MNKRTESKHLIVCKCTHKTQTKVGASIAPMNINIMYYNRVEIMTFKMGGVRKEREMKIEKLIVSFCYLGFKRYLKMKIVDESDNKMLINKVRPRTSEKV